MSRLAPLSEFNPVEISTRHPKNRHTPHPLRFVRGYPNPLKARVLPFSTKSGEASALLRGERTRGGGLWETRSAVQSHETLQWLCLCGGFPGEEAGSLLQAMRALSSLKYERS